MLQVKEASLDPAPAEAVADGAGGHHPGHPGGFHQGQADARQPEVPVLLDDEGRQEGHHGGVHETAGEQDAGQRA